MVAVITTDKTGKVDLSKEDLHQLLKDVYNEGFEAGKNSCKSTIEYVPIKYYETQPWRWDKITYKPTWQYIQTDTTTDPNTVKTTVTSGGSEWKKINSLK